MKKILKRVKEHFSKEIAFAKNSGFEGVLLPSNPHDGEAYYLEVSYPTHLIEEIAYENDWETFVYINLVKNKELLISLERNPSDMY